MRPGGGWSRSLTPDTMILLPTAHAWLQDAPGSFPALMDLYERNYIQIRRLLPDMPPATAVQVSQTPGALDLHLRIVERYPYTSELNLTYQFDDEAGPPIIEPDLRIRVYHDARQAEALTAHLRHHAAFSNDLATSGQLDRARLYRRWRINRFLYKWLSYCLWQGHRFIDLPSQSV